MGNIGILQDILIGLFLFLLPFFVVYFVCFFPAKFLRLPDWPQRTWDLLLQHLEHWDCRSISPCQASFMFLRSSPQVLAIGYFLLL